MCQHSRRQFILTGGGGLLAVATRPAWSQQPLPVSETQRMHFIGEAERMRQQAVRAGDQSYGAVLVMGHAIVGWGPSRVVTDRNANAHAERVAIMDAQARLSTNDVSGAVLYSTSRPCAACEVAAASARVARMYWGPKAIDAGAPRG